MTLGTVNDSLFLRHTGGGLKEKDGSRMRTLRKKQQYQLTEQGPGEGGHGSGTIKDLKKDRTPPSCNLIQ